MRKFIFLILFLFFLVGCSESAAVNFDEDATLVIEMQINGKNSDEYKVFGEIATEEIVRRIYEIIEGIKWETNVEYNMPTPDFEIKDHYHIWITPDGDQLEIMNIENSYFARLSKGESEELYLLMTGTSLSTN